MKKISLIIASIALLAAGIAFAENANEPKTDNAQKCDKQIKNKGEPRNAPFMKERTKSNKNFIKLMILSMNDEELVALETEIANIKKMSAEEKTTAIQEAKQSMKQARPQAQNGNRGKQQGKMKREGNKKKGLPPPPPPAEKE